MSATKRNIKSKGLRLPPFIPVLYEELRSSAYQELPGNAAKALPYFKWIDGVLIKKNGAAYNGIFDFTYSEAEKYGFARQTFNRIITELNAKGFINIVKQGGKRGCGMSNSKYRLSQRWRDYGKSVFMTHPRYPTEPPK